MEEGVVVVVFSMLLGWILVDVTQALTLQKVEAEPVLLPWELRALCSGGSAARRGRRPVLYEEHTDFCNVLLTLFP